MNESVRILLVILFILSCERSDLPKTHRAKFPHDSNVEQYVSAIYDIPCNAVISAASKRLIELYPNAQPRIKDISAPTHKTYKRVLIREQLKKQESKIRGYINFVPVNGRLYCATFSYFDQLTYLTAESNKRGHIWSERFDWHDDWYLDTSKSFDLNYEILIEVMKYLPLGTRIIMPKYAYELVETDSILKRYGFQQEYFNKKPSLR